MKLTVSMSGLDALSLRVKYLKTAAQRGLRNGVDEAAQMFEQTAKELVPVDTGHLRDSIHTETTVDEAEAQQRKVTPVVEAQNPWGIDPPYARRIEFGFAATDSKGRTFHQAAQPYMRPAFDANRDAAKEAIKDSIHSEMDNAMSTVASRRRR